MSVYRWDAADYSRNSAMQERFALDLLQRAQLRGDERVLDVGCGDGKVTAQIAARLPGGSVLGVDVSPDMVRFASKAYPASIHANLGFAARDASHLGFDSEFDLVVSFSALHWVKDHAPVLAGVSRALKPGGRFLAQFGGKGNMGVLDEIARAVPLQPKWSAYFFGFEYPWGFYSPDEYGSWLMAAGLEPVHLVLATRDVTHEGREGWNAWVRTSWAAYINRVPRERQEEFLTDLGDAYFARRPIDSDGKAHVRMIRLEVDALKAAA